MINGNSINIRPEDAAAFITAINQIQPYVPPIVFNQLANSPVAAMLAECANRRAGLAMTPIMPPSDPTAPKPPSPPTE